MDYGSAGAGSFADRAVEQLRDWPALEVCRAGEDLTVRTPEGGAEVARVRGPDEVELRLTWPVIQRLGDVLTEDGRVRVEIGSDWVRLRLHGASDVRLLVLLVSLAIREQAAP